jgi:Type III secretion system lipoprotein chaperone (YscW)
LEDMRIYGMSSDISIRAVPRMVLVGILTLIASTATAQSIEGTATYRERITLPPAAVFEAAIEDVSRADAPAATIARTRVASPGNPPIAFTAYDPARIVCSVSRTPVGCRSECDLERADPDAAGGRIHREQDGDRRVHRITRARARAFQRAGQTRGARLRPDHALHEQRGSRMEGLFFEAYAAFTKLTLASLAQVTTVTTESDVADAVYRAANDASGQLRFRAGADAVALAQST